MATIEKRGDSYRITAACGLDINGKQKRRRMTYKPDPGMTQRQIDKEVQRQAVLFQEQCDKGQVLDGNIKLIDFIDLYFKDYAAATLKLKTIEGYKHLTPYVNQALGHLRIDRIQPHHLNEFYKQLSTIGTQYKPVYKPIIDIKQLIKDNGLTIAQTARECNVKENTMRGAVKGDNVQEATAKAICKRFSLTFKKTFRKVDRNKPLSPETVRHYHRFISSVLGMAVKWQMILSNPCERVTLPKQRKSKPRYLDEQQAAQLLEFLEQEDMQHKTMIKMFMYLGLRREELCGLEWQDINFDTGIITISRASIYIPKKGIIADDTKNESSERSIKAPPSAVTMLQDYKVWQAEQAQRIGDRWQNSNRLFTTADGKPIHPDSITRWFHDFIKAHDLPDISIHSLRHTNATLLINSGTPITTIAARIGHANPSTTAKIYVHAIQSADAAAADVLDIVLNKAKTDNRKRA